MKVNFTATWTKSNQVGVPRGFIALEPTGISERKVADALNKLEAAQKKTGELKELDVSIDIHFKKRTLSMNNLMWALYEVEANEMNAGKDIRKALPHEKKYFTNAQELYNADVEQYAQVEEFYCKETGISKLKRDYSKIKSIEELRDGYYSVKVYVTTSHMSTKEHGEWIERQFQRLAENGVQFDTANDVQKYWTDYVKHRDEESDTGELFTGPGYKQRYPFCEACTESLVDGGGSIAHIVARGMGRNPMEGKYNEKDIMHLCDTHHALYDNGMGINAFIEKFPHLKRKIREGRERQRISND